MTYKHFPLKVREPSSKIEPMSPKRTLEMSVLLWGKTEHPKIMRRFPDIGSMIIRNWSEIVSSSVLRGLEFGEDLVELKGKVGDLALGLESLDRELSSCKECLDKLYAEFTERPTVKETRLFDIDEELEVLEPIPIVIEESEDEVIASFPEIEVFAVGAGEAEAISNLKRQIKELYYELITTSQDQLGKVPRSWLRVLEKVIKKVGQT